MLGVGLELAAARSNGNSMPDRGQYILQRAARRRVIQNFIGGNERQPVTPPPLAQARFSGSFFFALVAREQAVKAVAESVAQIADNSCRFALPDRRALLATPERNHSLRVAIDFVPGDGALPFLRTQSTLGDQAA